MSNTPSLTSAAQNMRNPKIDVRSVIIVAILSFGAGAYSAGSHPAAADAATKAGPSPTTIASTTAAAAPPGK